MSERFFQYDGDEASRARQKGEVHRDRFDAVFSGLLRAPFLPENWKRWIPPFVYAQALRRIGRKYARLHEPYLRRFNGRDVFSSWEALAAGLGRNLHLVYGLGAVEILSSVMNFSMGCTSLAFGPEHTADGRPRLAYNHDFPQSFGEFLCVEKEKPDEGYATLTLTYPTILGAIAGVNEKGLAISLNHAFATDIRPKPAIFITTLVRECLRHAANVEDALALARSAEVPNGSMITLVDASGNKAALEFSATGKSVRREVRGPLYTFNCYRCPDMADKEVPRDARTAGLTRRIVGDRLLHEHNVKRTERYLSLCNPSRKYDDLSIRKLLADHDGGEGAYHTICRHDDKTMNTIASSILNPAERSFDVIFGPACGPKAQRFTL